MGGRLRRCQRFKKFLYDKENRTICNRTKRNWFRIMYQYVLFLILAIGLFTALLYLIMFLLDLIGTPASRKTDFESSDILTVNMVPLKVNRELPEPLIWYTFKGEDSIENRRVSRYIKNIKDFLEENEQLCKKFPKNNCIFKTADFGPCAVPDYGYTTKKPCIFLKLNKCKDWDPMEYLTVPSNFPEDLKMNINKSRETVWVHCSGSTSYDDEHIGHIKYYPTQGFKDEYFPYKIRKDRPSLNPVLAIQLENLQIGHFVTLKCDLYSRNLQHDSSTFTYVYIVNK